MESAGDWWLVEFPHKGSVIWKACPYNDVISDFHGTVVLTSICKGKDINKLNYSINYLEQSVTFLWRCWRSPSVSCDVRWNQISGITLNVSLSLSFRAVDHIVKISFEEVIDSIKHFRECLNLLWVTHWFGNSLIFVFSHDYSDYISLKLICLYASKLLNSVAVYFCSILYFNLLYWTVFLGSGYKY